MKKEPNLDSVLWVCMDLVGTYVTSKPEIEKKILFFCMLDELRQIRGYDSVVFSFFSTEELKDEMPYIVESSQIINHVNDAYDAKIEIGTHSADNEYYNLHTGNIITKDNATLKAKSIVECGIEMFRANKIIKELLYIDDNPNINVAVGCLDKRFSKYTKEHDIQVSVIEKHTQTRSFCTNYPFFQKINLYDNNELGPIDFVINGLDRMIKDNKKQAESENVNYRM